MNLSVSKAVGITTWKRYFCEIHRKTKESKT